MVDKWNTDAERTSFVMDNLNTLEPSPSTRDFHPRGDYETLKRELASKESEMNSIDSKILWQFQTKDARVKLASLYLKIKESKLQYVVMT